MKNSYCLGTIALFIFVLSIPSQVIAKTYSWDDYSKPFDREIRFSGSVEIEVSLPKDYLETRDRIPLVVSYRRKSPDFYISLRANDQSRWTPYKVGNGPDSPRAEGSERVFIDKKYLKPGSNRLIFEFETKSPGMWYLDITAVKFEIEGTEKKSSVVASGESKGIYRWEDYSEPFNTEIRFGPKEKIVEVNFPEHVLKTHKQVVLMIKHSGLGDKYTHFSRGLQLSVNGHATDSGFEYGKNSPYTIDPVQILIETDYLKPGPNQLRFNAQSRHYGGYFSIYELYFDLSDIEKSGSMQTYKAPPKDGGERIFKWEDFTQPFKKRIPEIQRMHPATVEVFLPEKLSESDEIPLIIDTDLVVGNVFSARLLINSGSEWGAYRFDSSAAKNGQIKLLIKTKDLKPGLNKMLVKGHRFDIVGIRFEVPAALVAQQKSGNSEGANQSAAAGYDTKPSGNSASAEFPKMVVGDAWTLNTAFGLEHYKVTKVNPDGGFVVEQKEEKSGIVFQLHYDNRYRLVKKLDLEANQRHKIDDPPARYLDFPLYVGKKWEDKYYGRTLNRTVIPQELECNYLVDKIEEIGTRAGMIRAFKISRWFNSPSYAFVQREYYWYSPELKVIVKTDPIYDKGAELHSYRKAPAKAQMVAQKTENPPVIGTNDKSAAAQLKQEKSEVKKPVPEVSDKVEPTPQVQHSVAGVRWAVVIGVSNYKDSRIPSLRYANKDANAFHDWLVSPEGGRYALSRVKLLVDENATGIGIRNSLFEWLGQALEEDVVTIFFAGHGSPQSPDNPENLFLLPFDTNYDSVATTGFPMWDIETALKRFIRAKKVIVIADACHAGGVGQAFDVARRAGRGVNTVTISSNLQNLSRIGDGICIISASDDSQFSQESKKWGGGHGVFTYFLLRGLKGEADYSKDSRVTLGEIVPFLSEQVRRATRNAQSPTVAGRFDPALTIGK